MTEEYGYCEYALGWSRGCDQKAICIVMSADEFPWESCAEHARGHEGVLCFDRDHDAEHCPLKVPA